MNKKFVIAWIVLLIAWFVGSFVVHGVLLRSDYMQLTNLFRVEGEQQKYFPLMCLAHVILSGAFVWIYARGVEAKPWLAQGVRFGVAVALLTTVPTYMIYFVVQPMPGEAWSKRSSSIAFWWWYSGRSWLGCIETGRPGEIPLRGAHSLAAQNRQCAATRKLRPVSTPVGPSWIGLTAVPNSRCCGCRRLDPVRESSTEGETLQPIRESSSVKAGEAGLGRAPILRRSRFSTQLGARSIVERAETW